MARHIDARLAEIRAGKIAANDARPKRPHKLTAGDIERICRNIETGIANARAEFGDVAAAVDELRRTEQYIHDCIA